MNETLNLTLLPDQMLQAAIAGMDDGLILTDQQWKVLYANPAGARLLGHPSEALHGHSLPHLLAPDNPEQLTRSLRQAYDRPGPASGAGVPADVRYVTPGGRLLYLAVNASTVQPAGQPEHIVVTLRDVTYRIHYQRQLAALGALTGDLTRAPDLNTQLGHILDEGMALLHADCAGAHLVSQVTGEITHSVVRKLPDDYVKQLAARYRRGLPGSEASTSKSAATPMTWSAPSSNAPPSWRWPCRPPAPPTG